jgi:hypothetical protein
MNIDLKIGHFFKNFCEDSNKNFKPTLIDAINN